ncbi:enoyl-CoA hydratase/isomerase family protein [Pseudorhodoferax sp.]|uniref:enoyl-CoA hydratase/isomerase family protein n=1 Tax=Pseudorhodoferax sp. TaxID=1993553 RepID=UPI002DD69BDC|nr:enoyl-CoA hydratase/isomerase family protein [Pseudorhodoferax sp.]
MSTTFVTASRHGAVGLIELTRPGKFNALSRPGFDAIGAALDDFTAPAAGVRAVLVCAQGPHFCTGGDLDEANALRADGGLDGFLRHVNATLLRLEQCPLPVVAACQGLVLAGGLELSLCCDIVLAAADARFGDQHVQYGLVPAWGATQRLPRRIGPLRAIDLMFSGRWVDAQTALQWGLVTQVVDPAQLREEALRCCTTLAARSRPGLAAMKRLARAAFALPLAEGLRLERETVVDTMAGPDPAEGLAAFQARRPPRFSA